MPPYLAAEITDYIIGFVLPDKQGLCACSVVCQDWLPASRHHLFFNVSTSPTSYGKLVEQLKQSSSMRACLPSVHTFAFKVPTSDKLSLADLVKGQRFIHDFSGHLPNLQRAEFLMTFFSTKMHPHLHLALRNFQKLRELSLTNCQFDSFNSLRCMLVGLPGLGNLTMRFLAWDSMSSPSVPTWPPEQARPALECLSLALKPDNIPDTDLLIDWLISLPTPRRISLFMLGLQTDQGIDPLYLGPLRFMNCLASPSSVRELTISQFEIEGHHLDLSSLVNLENLELGLTGDIYPWLVVVLPAPRWDILCQMLQDVRSPLRRLRLSAYCSQAHSSEVNELDPAFVEGMEALDPVLEGKVFGHLEAVSFVARSQYLFSPDHVPFGDQFMCSDEPFREAVRVKPPKLYARGITTFAF
ncbi:hypothetical protein V8D89_001895 [Ganoderma adspersum]